MIYGLNGVVGSETMPSANCNPIGVLICIGPAIGGLLSITMSTKGGCPVTSSAPNEPVGGPIEIIIGDKVISF